MTDHKNHLRDHVSAMLAVETELREAFRRQEQENTELRRFAAAHQIVARAGDIIDRHIAALRDCLERLGADESALEQAVGGVLGAAAGLYDKMRSESAVSGVLRADHAALSFATVCYEMLLTTALTMKDVQTAHLALRHLKDYAPLTLALGTAVPQVLVGELATDGQAAATSSL